MFIASVSVNHYKLCLFDFVDVVLQVPRINWSDSYNYALSSSSGFPWLGLMFDCRSRYLVPSVPGWFLNLGDTKAGPLRASWEIKLIRQTLPWMHLVPSLFEFKWKNKEETMFSLWSRCRNKMNRMSTSCQLACRMVSISFTTNKYFSSLSAVGRYFATATEKVIINRKQASRNVFNHLTRSLHVDVGVHLIILQYTYQQFDEEEASSLVWKQESLVTKLRAAFLFFWWDWTQKMHASFMNRKRKYKIFQMKFESDKSEGYDRIKNAQFR